jgi:hypothetical protein
VDRRPHLHLDGRGLALCGRRDRPVLAPVVRWSMSTGMTAQLVADALLMTLAARQAGCSLASLGPGQPVRQRAVADSGIVQHEPIRQRLGQRGNGELLLVAQPSAPPVNSIARGTRPRHMCSTTSSGSTTAHQNTHLSMLLKKRDFADRDAIPRGISGSVALVRR